MRLNRYLAAKGICSRREADELIKRGKVLLDCHPATLGALVNVNSDIKICKDAYDDSRAQKHTFLVNKPMGFVSNLPENPDKRPVVHLLEDLNRCVSSPDVKAYLSANGNYTRGLAPVGRLDEYSTGLIVMSSDGVLARKLLHNCEIEKEYIVNIQGKVTRDRLNSLRRGHLRLDGSFLKPAEVDFLKENTLRIVLREGKYRQVRRMLQMVGVKTLSLARVRIGSITLDIPTGCWRPLGDDESFFGS